MKSVNFQKKFEADLRKKYLPDLETKAGLVGLVGVQYDRVIVKVDSTKEDKKTVYEHDGVSWVYVNKVENIEHEISFTDDHNIYITDKDRKPKLMGDVLPYEDIDDLLDKDPAIYNKLYITKKGKLYYYNSDGAYKLVSGGGGAGGTNRLTDVATYAEIITTYPKPDDWDCVVVLNDEGHDGQKTWYVFDGATWAYQGIYFNETLVQEISDRGVRSFVINADTNFPLPFEYIIGRKHLEIHVEDELLIQGIDYIEDTLTDGYVSNKIQFKHAIPKEARIIFKRKVATSEGDSRITRITGELWLSFLNNIYTTFDSIINTRGLSIIDRLLGDSIHGVIQNSTDIIADKMYLDNTSNNIYRAKTSKSGTWLTGEHSDFTLISLKSANDRGYKAKVTFSVGVDDKVTVLDSYNVSNVIRNSDGKFRITYTNELDVLYPTVSLSNKMDEGSNENAYTARIARGYAFNKNYIDIVHGHYNAGNFYNDPGIICMAVF